MSFLFGQPNWQVYVWSKRRLNDLEECARQKFSDKMMVNRRIIDAVVFMQMTLNCICFFESSSLDQSIEIIQSCMKDIDE